MLNLAEQFRQALVPFLVVGTSLLLGLLAYLVGQRLVWSALAARRAKQLARYRPVVSQWLSGAANPSLTIPRRHRPLIGELLVASVRVARGPEVERARAIAERLALLARWRAELDSSSWWRSAEAALALGLVHDRASVPALSVLLDDDHPQIRAAAIDALGQIGDSAVVPALLARLGNPDRHERTRMVEALRSIGSDATAALLAHGQAHPADRELVCTVVGFVGGAAAAGPLLEWTADNQADTRASAWRALALIGMEDRAFYHALKALGDPAPQVRAAAAAALARSGRADAAPHLAAGLDAEWDVAAQSARALGRLGADGTRALQQRLAAGPGLGHDLAQQVLWEGGHR